MNTLFLSVLLMVGCGLSAQACVDKNRYCAGWAKRGECCNNPKYMLPNCAKSCGQCGSLPNLACGCVNKAGDAKCTKLANEGQCCSNEAYMLTNCRKACAQCDVPTPVPGCPCMNHNSNCEGWAKRGLCNSVKKSCPRACGLCKNDLNTFKVCEAQAGTIQCPSGTNIQVERAFYGRKDLATCKSPGYMRTTKCEARGSDANIKKMCNGKSKCSIQASNNKFGGDPCQMTKKYAQVSYRCKPSLPVSNNCQGFDLGDDEIDKAVANSGACKAVEVMKTIQEATLCNAAGTQAFGSAKALFKKGIQVELICELISESLGLGLLFNSGQCRTIHKNIITPIMNGRFSNKDIERIIESQLNNIVPNLLNSAKAGVDIFNTFLDQVNFCPTVNFNPHAWKGKFDKVFELIKAIKKLNDKGPEILAKFAKNVASYNCKTYSVVFTVDISALAILGAQRGIYVTWHMDQGVKEVGVVNGVSASYNLDPDLDISIGATVALLMGDKGVWGEWGYTLEFGASVPIYGVGVGFSGGIVFTADAKTKALGNFVGFTMGIDFSLGESSTTVDYDASITCGYVAAESFKDKMKKNNNACLRSKAQAVNGLLNSFKNTGNVFDRKLDEIKRCGNLYACQAKQCAYGFSGKNFKTCQSAAGKCGAGMKECGKWEYSCKRTRHVEKNGSCKKRACRDVTRSVCKGVFGWFGWLRDVCNDVTNTVCDGTCLVWNKVVVPVTDTIITGTACAGQGMVEIAEKTKCIQHLPMCAATGGCYFGQGVVSAAECAGGMVIPSEKCLKDNKFA